MELRLASVYLDRNPCHNISSKPLNLLVFQQTLQNANPHCIQRPEKCTGVHSRISHCHFYFACEGASMAQGALRCTEE